MAEERDSSTIIGTTTQYRRGIITTIIIAAAIAAVVLIVVFFWLRINSGTRQAMREARDIRIAMKMKAIEQYGLGGTLYKATSRNGMAEGMEEDILNMADAEGEIVLQAWDKENNEPSAFTYQKDRYIIIFKQNEDGAAIWDGYYTLKLLEYE